jgi:predicted DNA-binding transcriptional regulator YafY
MSPPGGPAAKTERLLNLVLCLLSTRRPLPKSRIRQAVAQYGEAPSDEAFDRMFERDKDELRELGIPLVTEELSTLWEDEPGYRIDQREYALPEIAFEPDELAVLGLASRAWAQASLAGPAAQALRKLSAAGVERDGETVTGLEPRLRTAEPAFEAVKDAVLRQQPIAFGYRPAGAGEVTERHVQPWGLASWHGRWYLTGHDTDRGAPRVFRLSRFAGPVRSQGRAASYEVPSDHRPREAIGAAVGGQRSGEGVVLVRAGAGQALRRRATAVREEATGWSELTLTFDDAESFADELTWYGPDVVVQQPQEVRALVTERLQGAADAPVGEGSSPATTGGTARQSSGRGRSRTAPESATARLSRLLTMVPWLVNRQGVDTAEAAAGLGVTQEELEADLRLLFVCGYGSMPDELIDARWEDGRVYITNADSIARPLRLGVDEAVTLMVGLRALAAVPGLGEREAVERALAKLEQATGAAGAAASRVDVAIHEGVEAGVLAPARAALEQRRRLHLRYLVPSRDESTERDVDPMRVVSIDGNWYLEAFCHRAQGTRLFRMDRIEALEVLDADGSPPSDASVRDLDAGTFQPGPDDQLVVLRLLPGASWVSDYYPVEWLEDHGDEGQVVGLRTPDPAWLRRLLWRLGGLAQVVDPPVLGEQVRAGAREALAAYRGAGAVSAPPG